MPKKRTSGMGTVYYSDKEQRWKGQFSYTDPQTGNMKRKNFVGKTQRAVESKGKEFLSNIEDGLVPNADKITLWEWLDRWLNDFKKAQLRIKSFEKYNSCLKGYIKNTIGSHQISKLKAADYQRMLNNMLLRGGKDGQSISAYTVRVTRRYLIMALDKAVQLGIIAKNEAKFTEPPKINKSQIKVLSIEQGKALIKVARDGTYLEQNKTSDLDLALEYRKEVAYIAVYIGLYAGMRIGEVFGLRWCDVGDNFLYIRQGLVCTATQGMKIEPPKTRNSIRKVKIPAHLITEIHRYKTTQSNLAAELGDIFHNKHDLILTNSCGNPVDTNNFTRRFFKKMLLAANIDHNFRFHDLRHTHASMLLANGVNVKIISERLGHSTVVLTLDTYSHLLPDMQDIASSTIENLLKEDAKLNLLTNYR